MDQCLTEAKEFLAKQPNIVIQPDQTSPHGFSFTYQKPKKSARHYICMVIRTRATPEGKCEGFRLAYPCFWPLESWREHTTALETMSKLNKQRFAIKLFIDSAKASGRLLPSVSVAIDGDVHTGADLEAFLATSMVRMRQAVKSFRFKMQRRMGGGATVAASMSLAALMMMAQGK